MKKEEEIKKEIDTYAKVDFHIHSAASKTKIGDAEKTKDGVWKNIDVLLKKMNNSEVNIFSITDHNVFDYDLYSKTKKYISNSTFPYEYIKNIFPGVEFDLKFEDAKKRIHAICIFNDSSEDEHKIKKINDEIVRVLNGRDISTIRFDENDLTNIVRGIGLDFILIVHQKSDILNSSINGDNDFTKLDEETQDKLLYYDYFNLYESNQHKFRFNFENLKASKNFCANFITGTDCHTWSEYPDNQKDEEKFDFSYIKSDFSFEGIKIAITGNGDRRIFDRIPNKKDNTISRISVKIDDDKIDIPLSSGINAVIGGNTSGKSLLISTMFNKLDSKKNPGPFLKKWNINFEKLDLSNDKFEFIEQGRIRKLFESDNSNLVEEFKEQFDVIDYSTYYSKFADLQNKFLEQADYNSKVNDLEKLIDCVITIPNYEDKTYYPQISPLPIKPTNPTKKIIEKFNLSEKFLEDLMALLEEKHKIEMLEIVKQLKNIKDYYERKNFSESINLKSYLSFISGKDDYIKHVEEMGLSNSEKELLDYDELTQNYLENIGKLIQLKLTPLKDFREEVKPFKIPEISIEFNGLKFVTESKVSSFSKESILKILSYPLLQFELSEIDLRELNINMISNSLRDDTSQAMNQLSYKQKYSALLTKNLNSNYFADTFKVLLKDDEIQDTKSPGNNAIYYIKAKTGLIKNKIVVFDQPEDDVSPEKIRTELIKNLSKIAISNQVIIITHNPQLVVNLDVDNVICLDDSNNSYSVYNGPLYKKDGYNMLKIIADKLDGGKDALKERWKRYE